MPAERLSSYNMKCSIVAVLKRQMETVPFQKITVSSLTAECGINRKTFYYHFQDIYQAAEWMFDQELSRFFEKMAVTDYREALRTTLNYVSGNAAVIRGILRSLGRDYLHRVFRPSVRDAVRSLFASLFGSEDIDRDYMKFLEDFYADAMISMVLNWFENGMKTDTETMIRYTDYTLHGNVKAALLREEAGQSASRRS